MSKKFILRRSYADVVKGSREEIRNEIGNGSSREEIGIGSPVDHIGEGMLQNPETRSAGTERQHSEQRSNSTDQDSDVEFLSAEMPLTANLRQVKIENVYCNTCKGRDRNGTICETCGHCESSDTDSDAFSEDTCVFDDDEIVIKGDRNDDVKSTIEDLPDDLSDFQVTKFQCDICKSIFYTKGLLRRHLQLHSSSDIQIENSLISPSYLHASIYKKKDLKRTGTSQIDGKKRKYLRSPRNKTNTPKMSPYLKKTRICESTSTTTKRALSFEEKTETHMGLPYFERDRKSTYDHTEVADILLDPPASKICTAVPVRVQKSASFVIDIHQLPTHHDLTADDNGAYQTGSARKGYVFTEMVRNKGNVLYAGTNDCMTVTSSIKRFELLKMWSICKSAPDLKRWIYRMKDDNNQYHRYCIIQYIFKGDDHAFSVKHHGNRLHATVNAPYKQTAQSTRDHLKNKTTEVPPKEALFRTYRETGGILNASKSAGVPRNYKQAENFRRGQYTGSIHVQNNDILAAVMQQCKATINVPGKAFIRDVKGAPEAACVVATDNSLADICRFCTCERPMNAVLSVDPTFSLGDFYMTPCTYKNKSLISRKTAEHPVFLGPCLIHYKKNYATYHYLASTLIGIKPELANLKAFGTDGEEALVTSFDRVFHLANGLRDKRHSKKNVERKLDNLSMDRNTKDRILSDIYGKHTGNTYYEGLIDASDGDEFYNHLENVQWPENFLQWFKDNIAGYMAISMLKDVRQSNGLDKHFSTNMSESINAMIKRKTDHKVHELTMFLRKLKELFEHQEEIVRTAMCGEGDFQMSTEFEDFHLGEMYFSLSFREKESLEKKFYQKRYTGSCIERQPASNRPVTQENLDEVSNINMQSTTTKATMQVQKDVEIPVTESTGNQLPSLQIRGFTKVHTDNLMSKCNQILSNKESQIRKGFKDGDYFVLSGEKHHLVERIGNGQYVCDKNAHGNTGCLSFKASKMCSHIVVSGYLNGDLNEPIEQFNSGTNKVYNLTSISMHNIPKGAGRKHGTVRQRLSVPIQSSDDNKTVSLNEILGGDNLAKQSIRMTIRKEDSVHTASLDIPEDDSKPYKLRLLSQHPKVTKCHGCPFAFAKTNKQPPPAPHDLVLRRKERPTFVDDKGRLGVGKDQFVTYHVNKECLKRQNDSFLPTDVDYYPVLHLLKDIHRDFLIRQIGLVLPDID